MIGIVEQFETCPNSVRYRVLGLKLGLFALADQIEVRFAKTKAQVDELTPSLLARAFKGEL